MRLPLSPAEFDAALRRLEEKYAISRTSGLRTVERNRLVGGDIASKHLHGMAQDYVFDDGVVVEPMRSEIMAHMRSLGLWGQFHGEGKGFHLHVQGLPPGDIDDWWVLKYGKIRK